MTNPHPIPDAAGPGLRVLDALISRCRVTGAAIMCAGCWGGNHGQCEQPCQCGDLDHQDHASVSGGPTTKGRP